MNKQILQGLFFAPHVVASSLKTAVFASKLLENLGYIANPKFDQKEQILCKQLLLETNKNL